MSDITITSQPPFYYTVRHVGHQTEFGAHLMQENIVTSCWRWSKTCRQHLHRYGLSSNQKHFTSLKLLSVQAQRDEDFMRRSLCLSRAITQQTQWLKKKKKTINHEWWLQASYMCSKPIKTPASKHLTTEPLKISRVQTDFWFFTSQLLYSYYISQWSHFQVGNLNRGVSLLALSASSGDIDTLYLTHAVDKRIFTPPRDRQGSIPTVSLLYFHVYGYFVSTFYVNWKKQTEVNWNGCCVLMDPGATTF